jgi:hypothetical protein
MQKPANLNCGLFCTKVNQMLSKEEVKYKRKLDFDYTSYDFTARSGAVKVILIDIDRGKI